MTAVTFKSKQSLAFFFFFFKQTTNCAFGEEFTAHQAETLLFSIIATKMLKEAGSWTNSEAQSWSLCLETMEMKKWAEESVVSSMLSLKGREKKLQGRLLLQQIDTWQTMENVWMMASVCCYRKSTSAVHLFYQLKGEIYAEVAPM